MKFFELPDPEGYEAKTGYTFMLQREQIYYLKEFFETLETDESSYLSIGVYDTKDVSKEPLLVIALVKRPELKWDLGIDYLEFPDAESKVKALLMAQLMDQIRNTEVIGTIELQAIT